MFLGLRANGVSLARGRQTEPWTLVLDSCQVGSLAGAAHLLKDNAGVLR
jgi:hypothetical protein